jgi:hypothetical protein
MKVPRNYLESIPEGMLPMIDAEALEQEYISMGMMNNGENWPTFELETPPIYDDLASG